jgi:MYXO-CTERM domain-containing protein
MSRTPLIAAALAGAAVALAAPAHAEKIVGLVGGTGVTVFSSTNPNNTGQVRAISGLMGQRLVGLDVRPATGMLYGLGSGGGVFTISLAQGEANATQVASLIDAMGMPVALSGSFFGIDFNPVPDRLRVVSDADQNLRINVDTGLTITDGTLSYDPMDANAGVNPTAVAAAYTNSFAPSPRTPPPGTTLYYLDASLNTLATTVNPNGGVLLTVGGAGNPTPDSGFDISGVTGIAFASWSGGDSLDRLFTINLMMGTPNNLGLIGDGRLGITDIAVAPADTPAPGALALFGLAALALGLRRRA